MPVTDEALRRMLAGDPPAARGGGVSAAQRTVAVSEQDFADAMAAADFEPRRAAQLLGISRAAIYRRIEALDSFRLAHEIAAHEISEALEDAAGEVPVAARKLRVSARSLQGRLRHLGLTQPGQ